MATKRETVRLEGDVDDITELVCYGGRHDEWEFIEEDISNVDLEKGGKDMEVILKRKSDDKFFKFEFYKTNHHSLDEDACGNDWPLRGTEVFPKSITITKYE